MEWNGHLRYRGGIQQLSHYDSFSRSSCRRRMSDAGAIEFDWGAAGAACIATVAPHLDEAEHLRQGLVLLGGELEAHLCVLLLPHHGSGEVSVDEVDDLFGLIVDVITRGMSTTKRARERRGTSGCITDTIAKTTGHMF